MMDFAHLTMELELEWMLRNNLQKSFVGRTGMPQLRKKSRQQEKIFLPEQASSIKHIYPEGKTISVIKRQKKKKGGERGFVHQGIIGGVIDSIGAIQGNYED